MIHQEPGKNQYAGNAEAKSQNILHIDLSSLLHSQGDGRCNPGRLMAFSYRPQILEVSGAFLRRSQSELVTVTK